MKRLQKHFKNYLRNVGKIGELPLGKNKPTKQDSQLLLKELRKRTKYNSALILSIFIMIFILFGIGVFILFHLYNSPKMSVITYGGTFVFLLGIIRLLLQLWREKFILDHASFVLQKNSPEVAAGIIFLLYQSLMGKIKN